MQRTRLARPIAPEDQGRADLYWMLAQLFRAAPDAGMLRTLGERREDDFGASALGEARRKLACAAHAMEPEALAEEFSALFEGTGRAAVIPNASFYLAGFMHERPLARLRDDLAALGLGRRAGGSETEDHLGALCEVMHYLIVHFDRPEAGRLIAQKAIFTTHLQPWLQRFCEVLEKHPSANFYRAVAGLLRAFSDLEREQFTFVVSG